MCPRLPVRPDAQVCLSGIFLPRLGGPLPLNAVIIGLGYVGLPLAREAVLAGHSVVGLDKDEDVVRGLNSGTSHVDDLSDGEIVQMRDLGFVATADPSVIFQAEVVVICVPTPLSPDGGPELAAVLSAVGDISAYLRNGMTVVLESTTYPGTTEEVVLPMLERRGLICGRDFHLAFSPERIDPGNSVFGPKNTPKVVGGVTPSCTRSAEAFYGTFIDVTVPTRGTREAEMAKLLENTYRHVNIALVNEMARFCNDLEIDLWDVIAAAKTKPFGFHAFYPGPGVGGHCIPIDPNYLSHTVKSRLGYPFRFVELAQEINASMPTYVFGRIQEILNTDRKAVNGSSILLLGVTYKANISDQRESPAVPLARILVENGANVRFSDPYVSEWHAGPDSAIRESDAVDAAQHADIVVLLQNHDAFDLERLSSAASSILDTRGAIVGDRVYRI